MNPEKARKVLHEGYAILNFVGVKWWVTAGTLLMAHREGFSDESIELDTDIDAAVLGNCEEKEIRRALSDAGFHHIRSYSLALGPVQLAIVKDDIIFDIYFYHLDIEKREYHLLQQMADGRVATIWMPSHLYNPLGRIEIDGRSYPAPNDLDGALEHRYGGNWRERSEKTFEEFTFNIRG